MAAVALYLRLLVIGLGGGWRTPRDLAFFMSYFMPQSRLVLVDGGIYKPDQRDHENFDFPGNKASISGDFLKREYPELAVEVIGKYLGPQNRNHVISVSDIIHPGDVVFLQVDNAKSKNLVDAYARSLSDITLISGGTNADQLRVQVYLRRDSKDITPPFSAYCDDIANPRDESPVDRLLNPDGCVEQLTRREGFHPFTMMTTSTLMLNAFYTVWKLEKLGRLQDFPWFELWYDIVTGRCRTEKTLANN